MCSIHTYHRHHCYCERKKESDGVEGRARARLDLETRRCLDLETTCYLDMETPNPLSIFTWRVLLYIDMDPTYPDIETSNPVPIFTWTLLLDISIWTPPAWIWKPPSIWIWKSPIRLNASHFHSASRISWYWYESNLSGFGNEALPGFGNHLLSGYGNLLSQFHSDPLTGY